MGYVLKRRSLLAGLAGAAAAPLAAFGQGAYPNRPIRTIVPFAPGGGSDIVARMVGPRMTELLGQPLVIENKGGAGGLLGMEMTARAPADGYNILIMSDGFPALAATHKPAFDPMNSLVPVGQIAIAPFGLMVHPSLPVNNVREFIEYAKKNPGKLSYGSSGAGGLTHLITEDFKQKAGVHMVHIPYKSTGAAMPDLLAGVVQVYCGSVPPLLGHVQAKRLKLLAVTNEKRWPLWPDVPTIGETVKGFAADPWFGLFVPKGTPAEAIASLSAALAKTRGTEQVRKLASDQGLLMKGGSQEEFQRIVQSDFQRWSRLVKDLNFKPE